MVASRRLGFLLQPAISARTFTSSSIFLGECESVREDFTLEKEVTKVRSFINELESCTFCAPHD